MIVRIRVPDNATGIYYTTMEDGYENTDPKPVEMQDYISMEVEAYVVHGLLEDYCKKGEE